MSRWIFSTKSTPVGDFVINSNSVHRLEYIFQDLKPHLLNIDDKKSTCLVQFNRRIFRVQVEERLRKHNLFHVYVQGVFDPVLLVHPGTNSLINEPGPDASTSTQSMLAGAASNVAVVQPYSPTPRRSTADTSPIITVISLSSSHQLSLIHI